VAVKQEKSIEEQHKSDFLWQILLPVLGVALILVITAGFTAVASSGAVSKLADVSVIWLIVPMLVVVLVITAITIALIYWMIQILPKIPFYSRKAYFYVLTAQHSVHVYSDKVVAPIVKVKVYNAGVRAFFNNLRWHKD